MKTMHFWASLLLMAFIAVAISAQDPDENASDTVEVGTEKPNVGPDPEEDAADDEDDFDSDSVVEKIKNFKGAKFEV
jgi:hypothetical protein